MPAGGLGPGEAARLTIQPSHTNWGETIYPEKGAIINHSYNFQYSPPAATGRTLGKLIGVTHERFVNLCFFWAIFYFYIWNLMNMLNIFFYQKCILSSPLKKGIVSFIPFVSADLLRRALTSCSIQISTQTFALYIFSLVTLCILFHFVPSKLLLQYFQVRLCFGSLLALFIISSL